MSGNKLEIEVVDEEGDLIVDADQDSNESEVRSFDRGAADKLKELQDRFDGENRRARELEAQLNDVVRFAQGTVNENKRLSGLLTSGERVLLDQAGNRVKAEMATAEQAFKTAYESGDTEAMLRAQKAIADLTHQMKQVENYTPVQTQQYAPPPAPAPRQPQVDAKSEAWIRKNESWWMKDQPMTGFAMGIHTEIVKQGIPPGTDKYIEELDRRMSEAFPKKFQSAGTSPRQRTVYGQSGVAPATRTAGGKTTVRVTPTESQRAQARRLGVPIEAYMAEVIKEDRNG